MELVRFGLIYFQLFVHALPQHQCRFRQKRHSNPYGTSLWSILLLLDVDEGFLLDAIIQTDCLFHQLDPCYFQ